MMSTFHGLEVAKRGLFTQQSALYTTGHNISNANTDGYSRQRINMEQTGAFPSGSRNRLEIAGQMGSGVQAGSVQRVREAFLDEQFRSEAKKLGYYDALENGLGKMEDVMNEPTDQGLAKTMDRFWQSLQDLAVNPEDAGARAVVKERGKAVAETFNYLSNSIQTLQRDAKREADITVKNANSILQQIDQLNRQIGNVEPHGQLPNDLYDQRDRLIDDLSEIVSIDVSYEKSAASSKDIADGLATVRLADALGRPLDGAPALVDAGGAPASSLSVDYRETDGRIAFDSLRVLHSDGETASLDFHTLPSPGKLKGLADLAGTVTATPQSSAVMVSDAFPVNKETGGATFPEGTLTLTGSFVNEDGEVDQGETVEIASSGKETMEEIAARISKEEGLEAEVLSQDGEQRLLVRSEAAGRSAALTVTGDGAEGAGLQGTVEGSNEQEGSYASMLDDLDKLATSFATQFNAEHNDAESAGLEGGPSATTDFFSYGNSYPDTGGVYRGLASALDITGAIKKNAGMIAAANSTSVGDGDNARDLAVLRDKVDGLLGEGATVSTFYEGMIGGMAVETQEAGRMSDNIQTLRDSVQNRRFSVSQVSLDEEMTNMIKFQHAYNASSRNITAIDEMLDRVINQMGVVGR
ncbi:hypothetical protein AAV35_003230 [Salimicrobium jeotgali]|uniref:Flagellar hook-associated protein 1 n=2 Tax=Salimicrobium jeotgali TaxID=1230341 RepID=A0AAC8T6M2_9BACI|nr:flagellar hook-associated protein FlgK [Salimicrobium jeotgali]AKG03892.1 hypothetical protein AAV35_003230 [Salimicrobium jeotgali]MBM7695082.1 flagellar hook-associated protein 1 FlgK [Salimicrobium jeotgali]